MMTEREITQERITAYADASGDHNPIHIDAEFAARSMFEGTIAHGMLVLALMGEAMHEAHGDAWLCRGSMKVRFKAPTRPGDTVSVNADEPRERDGRTEHAVACVNQRGETLIEGRASVAGSA
jgi:acyl dehydratase